MVPCRKCEARCCRYFALQLDTPKRKADFEHIRWYLAHKGVTVFVEKRKWYLDVANECRYLTKDHKCRIYYERPVICREHATDVCERTSDDFEHDHVFRDMKEFDGYLAERFKKRKKGGIHV